MGLSVKGKTLSINTNEHEVYFELISTLDLLPKLKESREEWFKRLQLYEKENSVSINDMVTTINEIRTRDNAKKEANKEGILVNNNGKEMVGAYMKEIYVLGKLVNKDVLEKSDVKISDLIKENT
jgi:hypothetical protein